MIIIHCIEFNRILLPAVAWLLVVGSRFYFWVIKLYVMQIYLLDNYALSSGDVTYL